MKFQTSTDFFINLIFLQKYQLLKVNFLKNLNSYFCVDGSVSSLRSPLELLDNIY